MEEFVFGGVVQHALRLKRLQRVRNGAFGRKKVIFVPQRVNINKT